MARRAGSRVTHEKSAEEGQDEVEDLVRREFHVAVEKDTSPKTRVMWWRVVLLIRVDDGPWARPRGEAALCDQPPEQSKNFGEESVG